MIRVAILMDDIFAINPKKDTSFALALAAQDLGWELFYINNQSLFLDREEVYAQCHPLRVQDLPENSCHLQSAENLPLSAFQLIFLRSDPPFDQQYLYQTQLLDWVVQRGTLVVNNPSSVRDFNEKLLAFQFPKFLPETIVTSDMGRLKQFAQQQKKVVFKPLDGMGGQSIFVVKEGDENTSVILETLTDHGTKMATAQRFIPEITAGDKRILIIDGIPFEWGLARHPATGESRGNLAAGGSGKIFKLNKHELEVAETIGRFCREKHLLFVGLDMIGSWVTEINITSPTCVREISEQSGIDVAKKILIDLKVRLKQPSKIDKCTES